MTADYVAVADEAAVPEGGMLSVEVDGEMLIVFREGGQWYCLDDVCTHDGGSLSDGEYWNFEIKCPRHGARFDVRSGEALCMPATQSTTPHSVRVEGGQVLVRLNR